MQVHGAAARLLRQGVLHDRVQALEALTAQPLVYIRQTLGKTFGEQCVAVFAKHRIKLNTQVDYIVAQDAFDTPFDAVFQPHH